ncbi:MAG: VWA domain-containing protein [Afipia sp.]|nr:VWA domain-containing protein [Afipia sp.]OJW61888.1 MAG: pilus assembly protein TadG [Afipia sp. 64-13]
MSSKNRKSILSSVRKIGMRFRKDERGNIAVIFAFSLLPILGLVGAAVDYTRLNTSRTQLQSALDSAALMISKDAASLSDSDMRQRAWDYFNALYQNTEAPVTQADLQISYTPNTGKGATLSLSARSKINSDFVQIMGDQFKQLGFGSSSTTTWGGTRLRVALALDNTGSMASAGKMDALKIAAKGLIDQLKTVALKDEDVYVSIVPFAKDVNVGTANVNASWLKWNGSSDTWDEKNGSCSKKDNRNRTITNKTSCNNVSGTWTVANHNTWNGCVTDRDQDYDVKSNAPNAADTQTLFPADQFSSCPSPITPLTYDWTTLKSKIDEMNPAGNTNQSIGMAWGWLSLLQQSPLNAPAEDKNSKYTKVVILLSDGDNTENRFSTSKKSIDARQKLLCDNAKADGIQIFTIQVNTDGTATSDVMQYCATSSDKFFPTTSASGIASAFQLIGGQLAQLRIAQ